MWTWETTSFEAGKPLLDALSLRVPTAPTAFLKKLLRKGRIRIGNEPGTAQSELRYGDTIVIATSGRMNECIAESPVDPRAILYEDAGTLVIAKPAGLAVHRAAGVDDDLHRRVQQWLALRGERFRTSPVHRLDRLTSGPVIFGKGRSAIAEMGRRFMAGMVHKAYLALVNGTPPASGTLTSPVPAHGKLKPSRTDFVRHASSGDFTLLSLQLETGRRHQIRHQLATAGWPLSGDRRYGGGQPQATPLLHCHSIAFPRLEDDRECTIRLALSEAQQEQLASLEIPTRNWTVTSTEISAEMSTNRL